MTKKLRDYFPMLQTREAILKEINNNEKMWSTFYSWEEERQEEFLDFCTGAQGVKVMYDFVSKEVLNPESTPERIDELLSLLLKQEVHVMEVLPNDGTRLADESSLVIMDIVVQLSDGSIANLEIQKIGYKFPGERSACYSADLLLRQYKRVRSERKKKFSYKDIKDVYTIVLFKKFPDVYIHSFGQKSDSGLEFNLLQKYVFVALDNFKNIQHNKENKYLINSRLDAWIAFCCIDDPEMIIAIIEQYPEFRAYYEQIYDICRNIEGVMEMFSKELQELDRNTVQLMIDEMQEDLKQKGKELDLINQKLGEKNQELDEKNQELDEKNQELNEKNQELQAALARIRELEEEKEKANQ